MPRCRLSPTATVLRGAVLPERIPPGGLLIFRDGDPGASETTLSRLTFHYQRRAEIEAVVEAGTPTQRDAAFDALVVSVGAALGLDPNAGIEPT